MQPTIAINLGPPPKSTTAYIFLSSNTGLVVSFVGMSNGMSLFMFLWSDNFHLDHEHEQLSTTAASETKKQDTSKIDETIGAQLWLVAIMNKKESKEIRQNDHSKFITWIRTQCNQVAARGSGYADIIAEHFRLVDIVIGENFSELVEKNLTENHKGVFKTNFMKALKKEMGDCEIVFRGSPVTWCMRVRWSVQ